jgi:antitoxin component YwqK of YwqJK toxin-antitoxin module
LFLLGQCGSRITYTYHPNGKIASQTIVGSDGIKWTNTWNPDGKKAAETRTDPSGRITTYTNEPYTITIEIPGISKITTAYGPSGKTETFAFVGGKGYVIHHSDDTGAETHSTHYDADGHWYIIFPKPDGTVKAYFENGTNVITDRFGKELKRYND